MFPSNGKQTTMADGEVVARVKGKTERNWKDEESYSLLCLRDVAHEDCMNRAKIWYHKVKIYDGTSPVTKKKISPDLFESRVIMRMNDPFSEEMFHCLATAAAKHFRVVSC